MNKEIGQKIKELREANGWSQWLLAEKLGITQQAIAMYEIGARFPRSVLEKLPDVFGKPLSYFFGENNPPPAEKEERPIEIICEACGNTVPDGEPFCIECGHHPPPSAIIQRMGKRAPKIVASENDKLVDIYAIAGAGQAWEIVEVDPIKSVDIPLSFVKQISFALLVQGESMHPTLKNGCVVGVKHEDPFVSNEIYVVCPPEEGLSVKRVLRDNKHKGYILRSDSQNKIAYKDIFVPDSLADRLFVGRVVWVWQGL